MADLEGQPKKRRRRRGRRRGKGGGGQPQQQVQTQAPTQAETAYDPYDLKAEAAEMKTEREAKAKEDQSAEQLIDDLIPLILQERDLVVLKWMIEATGQSRVALFTQILRGAIIKERVNHREAMGGGGASSKNLEALSNRI